MAIQYNLLPRIIHSGLGVLTPSRGLTVLDTVLHMSHKQVMSQIIVSPFEWQKLMSQAQRVLPVRYHAFIFKMIGLDEA